MVEVSPDCIMRRSACSWRRGSSRLPSFRSQSSSVFAHCAVHHPSRHSLVGQSSARCRRAEVYRFPYSLRPLPELGALSGVDAVVSDSLRGDESTSSSATRVPKHVENRSQTLALRWATTSVPSSSTRRSWVPLSLRVCPGEVGWCPVLWSRFLGLSYALPSAEQWSTAR